MLGIAALSELPISTLPQAAVDASQLGLSYFPDESEDSYELDDAPYDFCGAGFVIPANTAFVPFVELPQAFEYDGPDDDEPDGEFYWAQAPPIPDTVLAASLFCVWPDEAEEPDDEDYSFADAPRPPDVVAVGQVLAGPSETPDELDDEDYGFAGWQQPEDLATPLSQFPDQSEEPEDEDHGIADWQVPPNFIAPQPLQLAYFPEEAEEAEDEDYGFDAAPLPADTVLAATRIEFPDQPEEAEDEDFGFLDWQLPANAAAPDQIVCIYPDEADEPEDEDFGGADWQLPADAILPQPLTLWYWPDEGEEAEDEDYAFAAAPLAADAVVTQDQFSPTLSDDVPEDDEEQFGFDDSQIPEDFIPPPVPPVSTGGGDFAMGGGKRNLPCLEELDVFKKLECRRPGQTIVEALRELDTPAAIEEVQEVLREAKQAVADLSSERRHRAEIRGLQAEIASLQKQLKVQHKEVVQKQQDEDDDDDDLLLIGML